jgi:hypothetical protein
VGCPLSVVGVLHLQCHGDVGLDTDGGTKVDNHHQLLLVAGGDVLCCGRGAGVTRVQWRHQNKCDNDQEEERRKVPKRRDRWIRPKMYREGGREGAAAP